MDKQGFRIRSRTGCFTCRKRKKRCDEVRPTCSACSRLGISCEYPAPGTEYKNRRRRGEKSEPLQNDQLVLCDTNAPVTTQEAIPLTQEEIPIEEITRDVLSTTDVMSGFDIMCDIPISVPSLYLDADGLLLYDYFINKQAWAISVAPENSFLNVFVPMANHSPSVLHSIVAWAAYHRAKGEESDIGDRYLQLAVNDVKELTKNSGGMASIETVLLASMLLIASAEICSGDVVKWKRHLSAAARLIGIQGGLKSFALSKELRWLAVNFAYHDLLASSTYTSRALLTAQEYDFIMKRSFGAETLVGCCQPLFQMLAEISELAYEARRLAAGGSGRSDEQNMIALAQLSNNAKQLEDKISVSMPDELGLIALTDHQIRLHMTLFSAFQLTCKLHLAQSVMRMGPSSTSVQLLNLQLIQILDLVLDTEVEGILILPLFIAGLTCSKVSARKDILKRIDAFYERNNAGNIKRVRELLLEIWEIDTDGTKFVDWYSVVEKKGWDLNFA